MPEPKRGGELLRKWLADERRSQDWLGEQIGSHQTNISAWIRGRTIPLDMAIAIRAITGIEVETWAQPAAESSRHLSDVDRGDDEDVALKPGNGTEG